MSIPAHWEPVLAQLDHYRALLVGMVADQLTYTVPLLAVPASAGDPLAHHQRQMYTTVERLHDDIQAMRVNEQLLIYEFQWGAAVLSRWGLSGAHLEELLDRYVGTARAVGSWTAAEHATLEEIGAYLRAAARAAFAAGDA